MSKPHSFSGFADVIIGLQYGDEGKAAIVDMMAEDYDIVSRFNGGSNAGHTLQVGNVTLAMQQIPSGVFYPKKILAIGSGCVLNVVKLAQELEKVSAAGFPLEGRLKISPQATVVQPHHLLLDAKIGAFVGTTKNGIGPAYADRALRMWGDRVVNIRMADLLADLEGALAAIRRNTEAAAKLYGLAGGGAEEEFGHMRKAFSVMAPFIEPDPLFVSRQVNFGKRVLFEGAQSFMLDVVHGSIPYVTSSHTVAAAAYVGGDIPPQLHRKTIGIAKAIMSRVGHGPFVSELGGAKSEEYCMAKNPDGSSAANRQVESACDAETLLRSDDLFEIGKAIRILSGEYGTVTARPRRVGMLDLVQLKYAAAANGVAELILNKCDLLQVYSRTRRGKIPIVTGYELDSQRIDYVPAATSVYSRVKPVVEYRAGFSEDISGVRSARDLPPSLKNLLHEIEAAVGCPVTGIGVGPEREQFVKL